MASLMVLNGRGKYQDDRALKDVIAYALNPQKTYGFVGGQVVGMDDPAQSMEAVAEKFGKNSGVRLRHYVLSFSQQELTDPEIAYAIASSVAEYIAERYQVVYGVHQDTDEIHVHFVANTINFKTGERYGGKKAELYGLIRYLNYCVKFFGIQYVKREKKIH